jgi:hypothetical protein
MKAPTLSQLLNDACKSGKKKKKKMMDEAQYETDARKKKNVKKVKGDESEAY